MSSVDGPFASRAATYAAMGLQVFPVAPIGHGTGKMNGKEPYPGTHALKDATTDLQQIANWAERYPDANIGLACEMSGLVVVDVDLDLDDPVDAKRWEAFRSDNQIPATFTQRTPGGGLHLFFQSAPGARYPSSLQDAEGKVADIRHNAYVVMEPSIALSSRRDEPGTYKIIDDRPPVPAPDWLAAELRNGVGSAAQDDQLDQLGRDVRDFIRKEKDDRLLRLLQNKRNTIKHRDEWRDLGFGIKAGYAGTRWEREAEIAWIAFSARWEAPPGTTMANFEENAQRLWDSADENRRRGVGPATANMILSKLPDLPDETVKPVVPAELGEVRTKKKKKK